VNGKKSAKSLLNTAFKAIFSSSSGFANGTGLEAMFNVPLGLCIDAEDGSVLVCDSDNHVIRYVLLSRFLLPFFADVYFLVCLFVCLFVCLLVCVFVCF
jgi:hypothetical protein